MLIVSDRDGGWERHFHTVHNLLSTFCESDSINYLRYGSCYIEKMQKLSLQHLEVSQHVFRRKDFGENKSP